MNNLNLHNINNNKEIQMPYLNKKLSTYHNIPYKITSFNIKHYVDFFHQN